MTYILQPKDQYEGVLLWAKVALVTFVGIIEPLFEPYPYVPYDPSVSIRIALSLRDELLTHM